MEQLLEQYNPHWGSLHSYRLIPRQRYLDQVVKLVDRREIIVLKGIRRCGKSSLLKLIINRLMERGVSALNILFMNLEDYRLGSEKTLETLENIYQSYLRLAEPRGRHFILLDEIQEIPEFERWLRTHYEQNESLKFIITGSSSSLFSDELATLLTGRQISMEVFPFSFNEYVQFRDDGLQAEISTSGVDALYLSRSFEDVEPLLNRFLSEGGFPEVVKHPQTETNLLLLQQYISDVILKDITRRYNIRKSDVLQKLTLYLIYNMGSGINVTHLAQLVGSNRTTVLELISYLRETYMIFTVSAFSFSMEAQITSTRARKIFCIDNGFFAAIKTASDKDFKKRFSNAVFTHLRFQWGETLFYWKDKVEVDFVLKDGFPISISSDVKELEKKIQHLFYFLNQHNLPRGLLITWNKLQILEENEKTIILMPLWLLLCKSRRDIIDYES